MEVIRMAKGYMFYDDETYNSKHMICQLAYILTDFDGNTIGDPTSSYIKPIGEKDQTFDHNSVKDSDLMDAPSFAEFCETSGFPKLLEEYVFISHGACNADLHHLRKTFVANGMEIPDVEYIDTKTMAANNIGLGRLVDICNKYSIDLPKHHDAACDAKACMDIFWRLANEFGIPDTYIWVRKDGDSKPRKRSGKKQNVNNGSLGKVHESDETVEEVLQSFEATGQVAHTFNPDSFDGLKICISGSVPGYNRDSIKNVLKNMGATVQKNVCKNTQFLCVGDNVGPVKITDAHNNGTPVINVIDLLNAIDNQ